MSVTAWTSQINSHPFFGPNVPSYRFRYERDEDEKKCRKKKKEKYSLE